MKDRVYQNSVIHGFHEKERPNDYYLGLIMSECGEAINADRKGKRADYRKFLIAVKTTENISQAFETYCKDSVEDEFADIIIRLLDFAGLKKMQFCDKNVPYQESILSDIAKDADLPSAMFDIVGYLSYIAPILTGYGIKYVIDWVYALAKAKYGINVWIFVELKMKYNETRPKYNGKKY